jgi:hypothetical protein
MHLHWARKCHIKAEMQDGKPYDSMSALNTEAHHNGQKPVIEQGDISTTSTHEIPLAGLQAHSHGLRLLLQASVSAEGTLAAAFRTVKCRGLARLDDVSTNDSARQFQCPSLHCQFGIPQALPMPCFTPLYVITGFIFETVQDGVGLELDLLQNVVILFVVLCQSRKCLSIRTGSEPDRGTVHMSVGNYTFYDYFPASEPSTTPARSQKPRTSPSSSPKYASRLVLVPPCPLGVRRMCCSFQITAGPLLWHREETCRWYDVKSALHFKICEA